MSDSQRITKTGFKIGTSRRLDNLEVTSKKRLI